MKNTNRKTYPNQRIYRATPSNTAGKQRIQVDKDHVYAAYRILKPTELIIWMDAISNKANHTWAYSSQDMSNRYGMSVSSAKQAFTGLIEKGFAVHIQGNAYEIHSFSFNEEYNDIYEAVANLSRKNVNDEDIAWTNK